MLWNGAFFDRFPTILRTETRRFGGRSTVDAGSPVVVGPGGVAGRIRRIRNYLKIGLTSLPKRDLRRRSAAFSFWFWLPNRHDYWIGTVREECRVATIRNPDRIMPDWQCLGLESELAMSEQISAQARVSLAECDSPDGY